MKFPESIFDRDKGNTVTRHGEREGGGILF